MFGWHAGVGTGARGESSASAAPQMDRHVYAVTGDPREEKSRYQNFHISGSKGDVYTVAGWAKGDSVPLKDGTRKFGITARFTYTDGTTDDQTVLFTRMRSSGSMPRSGSWRSRTIPCCRFI